MQGYGTAGCRSAFAQITYAIRAAGLGTLVQICVADLRVVPTRMRRRRIVTVDGKRRAGEPCGLLQQNSDLPGLLW